MSKKQEHPILFILAVGIFSVILLFLFYTNIIIFFFVLMAVLGWNIGLRFRKRQEIAPQPSDDLQKYITQIDEMMKER
ncbi:MAG: hypothetical protein JSW11_04325 [Candidatus Heimdallarchaeota archaeon]|nr:MAG: hypothetical protein JSW11_04325 [Candidatus Heimdallarchaeota archaeon]